MRLIIDGVAFLGGACVTAGVYLLYGAPGALIVGGSFLIAMAINAARINEAGNVSDS